MAFFSSISGRGSSSRQTVATKQPSRGQFTWSKNRDADKQVTTGPSKDYEEQKTQAPKEEVKKM